MVIVPVVYPPHLREEHRKFWARLNKQELEFERKEEQSERDVSLNWGNPRILFREETNKK